MDNDKRAQGFDGGEWAAELEFLPEGGAAPGDLPLEDGEFLYWDWIVFHSAMDLAAKLKWIEECYSHVADLIQEAYPVNTPDADRFNTVGLLYSAVWPVITNPLIARDPLAGQQALEWIQSACNLLWDLLPDAIRQADQAAFMGKLAGRVAGAGPDGDLLPPEQTALALAMGQRLAGIGANMDAAMRGRLAGCKFDLHYGPQLSPQAAQSAKHSGAVAMETEWQITRDGTLIGTGDAAFCSDPGCQTCYNTIWAILFGPGAVPALVD